MKPNEKEVRGRDMDKKIIVVKTGNTFASMKSRYGDFEDWISRGLGVEPEMIRVVNASGHEPLPGKKQCMGAVVAGSHAMVTDDLDWSLVLENWLREMVEAGVPILGICYGHQVLARAMGGQVDYHPRGIEIGCVDIKQTREEDPLFHGFPEIFKAHVCHSQTVVCLPAHAVHMAGNDFEPHHAYRLGDRAWGVQFHPEYDRPIMKAYVEYMQAKIEASGRDLKPILDGIEETPHALKILERFGRLCLA
ncbi:glutamine amidotransferase [Desulfospira joergensenii]|uniref:glutamine amidotransferase n=1 Tax=Desulfospira joergensenii TaxID=53329 RepID=UPI0003B3B004|nr:glutamine amidotransferase [Desulfospira joergensenii]